MNAGYGHTVGTLQGLSLIPVAIGGCTVVPSTMHAVPGIMKLSKPMSSAHKHAAAAAAIAMAEELQPVFVANAIL